MEKMRNFFKDESGATMVEYGLMVALIAVACIAVSSQLWAPISTRQFNNAATQLSAANKQGRCYLNQS